MFDFLFKKRSSSFSSVDYSFGRVAQGSSCFFSPSQNSLGQLLYPEQPVITCQNEVPANGWEGLCAVCGKFSRFKNFTDNLRESGNCLFCGSSNRQRQMAFLIRKRFLMSPIGELAFPSHIHVYNTESSGPLHRFLHRSPSYVFSEYFGEAYASGEVVKGIRNENLHKLSFSDNLFDLVLSSDVFEHLPFPYRGHEEIFRVLKGGGRHIFTVPCNLAEAKDQNRARLVNGEIEYLAEKVYHGDPVRPNEGILVWTIFGREMVKKLEEIGFLVSVWNLYEPEYGIIGLNQIIFEAIKP